LTFRNPLSKERLYGAAVECLKKALEEIFDLPCIVIDWNQYIVNVSQAAETIYEHEEEDLYG
jgi:hypothetical protein